MARLKNSKLLSKIAEASGGKVIVASAKPVQDNWGHYASIMPLAVSSEIVRRSIDALNVDRTNVFGLCIHHTDTDDIETARKVLKSKSFSTHLIIDTNGDVTVELPLGERAAACVGFNKWMWQLDVVGRLHIDEPTKLQVQSLTNVIRLLACGRQIANIDSKFASQCRKLDVKEVQKATEAKFGSVRSKLHIRDGKLDLSKVPFTVIYHGEVRQTKCCGEHLIKLLPEIMENAKHD